MLKKLCLCTLTVLLAAVFYGCAAPNPPANSNGQPSPDGSLSSAVTVVVTWDFGNEVLLEETVAIEPDTRAMDVLQKVASVETKYGGGFVDSINGIGAGSEEAGKSPMDWFLYINGIASNVGAADYILGDGDVEHWDFRNWSYHQYVPAIIGNFPQSFRRGYKGNIRPTVVVYEAWLGSEAESLVEHLERAGILDVSAVSGDQLSGEVREQNNLIILAEMDSGVIAEINSAYKKLGLSIYFDSGKIVALDADGNTFREFGSGSGVIQATQNPWQPKGVGAGESVVWMVTGNDETGVRSAVEALMYQDFKYAYAVVISGGEIFRVPQ